jgi:lysophospholipase L1-like esterase
MRVLCSARRRAAVHTSDRSNVLARQIRRAAICATAVLSAACDQDPLAPEPDPVYPDVRIVTFGDSNTDYGYGAGATIEARSYVSNRLVGRLPATAPHHPNQLAGLIEAGWLALDRSAILAVNHGIGGTHSGGGLGGGSNRHPVTTAPHARTEVDGVTRFEAEVLGAGYPWNGGESNATEYPDGGILRANAFVPGAHDFAYVSMGTNDQSAGLTPEQTIANLTWMIERWLGHGRSADHLMITTLAPRDGADGTAFPEINAAIRALAAAHGVKLIDLAAFTSNDDGLTWKAADLHVGDSLHYTTAVRQWLADQVVAHMSTVIQPVLD